MLHKTSNAAGGSSGSEPAREAALHTSIDLSDILSLTDFQRGAKQHIGRLRRTGKAQVLTVNGAASLVVQDARAYQRLLDEVQALREKLNAKTSLVAAKVEHAGLEPLKESPKELAKERAARTVTKLHDKQKASEEQGEGQHAEAAFQADIVVKRDARAERVPETLVAARAAGNEPAGNEPASDGLARALAQLRQQLQGRS